MGQARVGERPHEERKRMAIAEQQSRRGGTLTSNLRQRRHLLPLVPIWRKFARGKSKVRVGAAVIGAIAAVASVGRSDGRRIME